MSKYSGGPIKRFEKHAEEMFSMAKEEARKMLDDAGIEDAALLDVDVWYTSDD